MSFFKRLHFKRYQTTGAHRFVSIEINFISKCPVKERRQYLQMSNAITDYQLGVAHKFSVLWKLNFLKIYSNLKRIQTTQGRVDITQLHLKLPLLTYIFLTCWNIMVIVVCHHLLLPTNLPLSYSLLKWWTYRDYMSSLWEKKGTLGDASNNHNIWEMVCGR